MKIYTKTGDQGETGLWGGERVPKDHLRIHAYGALDECNAALGMALSNADLSAEFRKRLLRIQGELFQLGAELATPRGKKTSTPLLEEEDVTRLESEIDQMEGVLKPLRNFILPGGCSAAAALHLARTISRRAERSVISLHRAEPLRHVVLEYLNRLSDYLFVCARFANQEAAVAESAWVPRR